MSKLPFGLLLALRYLRPKRTFVSIITFISVLGVAPGVAVLIIVIIVMSGFDHDLRSKILGFNSHLKNLRAVRVGTILQEMAGRLQRKGSNEAVNGSGYLPAHYGRGGW
jgi:ABC-type lipoprotein release transport system permease subunit